MKLKTAILTAALIVTVLSLFQAASAATAYYVSGTTVYVRSKPGSYALGRLYTNERMDIQDIDSNGWAYGYAYGYVNRCVWAQFREHANVLFRTNRTSVTNRCRTTNRYLDPREFTNGEIWTNASGSDGVEYALRQKTEIWDNWVWGRRWGNHRHRGTSAAGSIWKIRYTTNDGGGVMARPCTLNANGSRTCHSDWMFIQRSSLN